MLTSRPIEYSRPTVTSLHQPVAEQHVTHRERKERAGHADEHDIEQEFHVTSVENAG